MTLTLLHHTENGLTTTQVCGNTLSYFKITFKWKINFCTLKSRYDLPVHLHRQQELKEDMSAGKTRDALMKVFLRQKLNYSLNMI